jgi:ribonuclease VapC
VTGVVIDTSAAVALLSGESDGAWIIGALDADGRRVMSAASLVELGIVLEARFGPVGLGIIERFLREADVEVVALDHDQAGAAVSAWRRFGTGRHAAGLNLGDCFTYALAEVSDMPILCTGDDFGRTDLPTATAP